ncbi:MAG: alpha-L-glutamate ligase-like protein [Thermodesulfobacteriota bacterium]
MIGIPAALRRAGVLGMNGRNVKYIQRTNPRRLYPMVDDKLFTKRMCASAGVPVPRLLGAIEHHFELGRLGEIAARHASFVVKPARGAMGNGIIVVEGRDGDAFLRSGGRRVTLDDIRFHAAEILAGLYALAGHLDRVVVEERLDVHPALASVASGGVPDVRVVVYRGVPAMSMVRLPTRASAGRANLHQGAVGAGIDLASGRTVHAILDGRPVEVHPDTERRIVGVAIPDFATVLRIAVELGTLTGLGYVGVDVVVDPRRGPVVLEANARPGLAIQLANRAGLVPRLSAIDRRVRDGMPVAERVALGADIARRCGAAHA